MKNLRQGRKKVCFFSGKNISFAKNRINEENEMNLCIFTVTILKTTTTFMASAAFLKKIR
jgi:hypothetical protein